MMVTYTKGPWALDGDIGAMNLDVVYGSGRIAMIDCENEALTDAEVMANARMIAATPDLLAALDKLVAVVPVEYDYHGNPVDLELAHALDEAEKLIAELKG